VEDDAMNPAAWVERHARRQPDDPALAEGDRVHASWSEFATRTAGAATSLRDHFGLMPGDRVAIVMSNRPEYLEALYAIWRAGLAAVPVNARLHRDEIAYILEHSESVGPAHDVAAVRARRPAAGGPGVAVLHQRHHRKAQGRHPHAPQPADGDAQLFR
jgi:acyl-CoA synthetase (AMP-forming)/AMP-acid ligase II